MENKFNIVILSGLVGIGALSAFNTFTVLKLSNTQQVTENVSEETGGIPNTEFLAMSESITANIAKTGPANHVVRIGVTFEIDKDHKDYKTFATDMAAKEIVIKDNIIKLLRSQTYEDLSAVDAQQKLGEEIKRIVNEKLHTEIITNVLFSEFFVQ